MRSSIRSVIRKAGVEAVWAAAGTLLIWTMGFSLAESAVALVAVYAAIAIAGVVVGTYRKLFPNLVRAREKEQADRTFVGDGDI